MLNVNKIITFLTNNTRYNSVRCISETSAPKPRINKPIFRQESRAKKIGPLGWFLLAIPAGTFCLGTWQVQRKKWKEDLIKKLRDLTQSDPVPLPEDLQELENMEYRPVRVRGKFLHDREIHMGPRTLILKGDSSTTSQLMSSSSKQSQGYLIITPFKLADRNDIILINRGWVPGKCKNPATRTKGQVEDEVDVIGVVRMTEHRPRFVPANQEENNQWFYKDLHQMSRVSGALPILLDATTDFNVPEGPVGGQTRINLRNEHLSYVFTWYSLSLCTSYLWYVQFIKR